MLDVLRTTVFATAITMAGAGMASALTVFEDFEGEPTPSVSDADLTNSDLFFFQNASGSVRNNIGREGNHAWYTGAGSILGAGDVVTSPGNPPTLGAVSTIPAKAEFSILFGQGTGGREAELSSTNGRGAVGFGYTKATAAFRLNNGTNPSGGTTVAANEHISVGLYKLSNADSRNLGTPADKEFTYTFAWGNGSSNSATTLFPTESNDFVLLTVGHFYLLHGTIEFDGVSKFTFNLTLDDWGTTGEQFVETMMTGSGSATLESFGTLGQPQWWANTPYGPTHLDNIYVNYIPEPAALSLMGVAGLMGLRRRRMA